MMPFYHYQQNNTGGSFQIDDNVTLSVFIEATDSEDADRRALDVGIYFDGCDDGRDCECCGDRWSSADWSGSTIDGPAEWDGDSFSSMWLSDDQPAAIFHFMDGRVERYDSDGGLQLGFSDDVVKGETL